MSVEPKSGALIKWAMVISVSSKDVPSIDELSTDMLLVSFQSAKPSYLIFLNLQNPKLVIPTKFGTVLFLG